jgi:hypothetical protein
MPVWLMPVWLMPGRFKLVWLRAIWLMPDLLEPGLLKVRARVGKNALLAVIIALRGRQGTPP